LAAAFTDPSNRVSRSRQPVFCCPGSRNATVRYWRRNRSMFGVAFLAAALALKARSGPWAADLTSIRRDLTAATVPDVWLCWLCPALPGSSFSEVQPATSKRAATRRATRGTRAGGAVTVGAGRMGVLSRIQLLGIRPVGQGFRTANGISCWQVEGAG
jgi:hypothetical protein